MKPQYAKEAVAGTEKTPATGGLDQALTKFARLVAGWMKRWYKPILAVMAVVIVVALGNAVVTSFSESRLNAINDRISRVLSAGQEAGGVFDSTELDTLRADLKGQSLEGPFASAVVSLLLDRADRANAPEDPLSPPEKKVSADDAAAARDKAGAIAGETAERHPDDPAIQAWAQGVRRRIGESADQSWMPKPWSFGKLPVPSAPPGGESAPSTPPPAAPTTAPAQTTAPATTPVPAEKTE